MLVEAQNRKVIKRAEYEPVLPMDIAPLESQLLTNGAREAINHNQVHVVTVQARKTVARLVGFFSLILVLAFGLNALITSGLRLIKTSTYGTWNEVMLGEVNADVIISGSSRAASHYDPRAIKAKTGYTAFNLGQNGSQTDVQLAVLRTYLEHNRKPRLVIHNLDAFSFVTTREVFNPALYVPYLQDPELYQTLKQISPDFVRGRYLPLYGYVVQDMNFAWVLGLERLLGRSPVEDHFAGFAPQPKKWTDDFQNFKANNPNGVSFAIEPKGIQAVEQLIRLCHDNKIQLLFVYSPEYSEMQSLENNREEIFSEFRSLSSRYHIPIWDYSNWRYVSERDYFYNSQHLNANGAAVFSADIASRLQEYLPSQPFAVEVLPIPPRSSPLLARR